MIVISNNTEYKMREDLKKILKEKPNQRCFYIRFSQTDIARDTLFEAFLRILQQVQNSYMARVYLCQDKDILIAMEGFMQRHFMEFVQKIAAELKIKNLSDLVDMYEIGLHWHTIESLFTDKIAQIENAEAQVREDQRKKTANQNTLNLLARLKPELVNTVSDRRQRNKNPKVMIADDDALSRTLAGNVLREKYDLCFAINGREAIEQYVTAAPDILFLDIGMPDIGGHEVLETLFQIDPHAYIIMFSGRTDKTTIVHSLNIGAQGFLGKPFTRHELFSHVESAQTVKDKACLSSH